MTQPRHRWSEPNRPSVLRTERTCLNCGLLKVTRHDGPDLPWTEFIANGRTIQATATPPCQPPPKFR